MLAKQVKYHFMSLDQIDKCIDKLKDKIDNEADFDKRLKYLEEVAVIMNVLISRNKDNDLFMKHVRNGLNELSELVK